MPSPMSPTRHDPPRWKLAVVGWVAVYPVVTLFQWALGPLLAPLPLPLRTLLATGLMAPALTYAAMPLASRLLRGWLAAPTTH